MQSFTLPNAISLRVQIYSICLLCSKTKDFAVAIETISV